MLLTQKFISNLLVSMFVFAALILYNTLGFQTGAIAIAVLPFMVFVLIEPRRALLFSWFFLVFLPLPLREYLGPSRYHFMNEIVVTILWTAWIGRILIKGGGSGLPRVPFILGVLIFFVSFVSFAVNRVNPVYWIEWVFSYLLPLPVLGITRLYLRDYSPRRLLRMIAVVLSLQFALNILWHAGLNPLRNGHIWLDLSCGTYGNTAATAYVFIAAIGGGLCYLAVPGLRPGRMLAAILLMVAAAIQVFFTFTTHAHVFLPVAVFAPLLLVTRAGGVSPVRVTRNVLLLLGVLSLALVPLTQNRIAQYHRVVGTSGTEYAAGVWHSVWHGPKVGAIRRVLDVATPVQLAVGMGPNAAVSYTAFLLKQPQTYRLIGEWFHTLTGREELSTGSIRENIFSGIVMLLSEVGLIGLTLYLALLIYPLWHLLRRVRYYRTGNPAWFFIAGSVFLLLLINILIGLVWDVWRIRMFSTTTWLLAGRIWDPPSTAPDPAASAAAAFRPPLSLPAADSPIPSPEPAATPNGNVAL